MFHRFFFALFCLCLLAGCQSNIEQQRLIMPDVVVAVAPFTQPVQTAELLSGFIPEEQAKISNNTLANLDSLFRQKLHRNAHSYIFLKPADLGEELARDSRGRRNALATWAEYARRAGADLIVVPHIITLQERVGGKAGIMTAAAVNEDFYLIDAREPASLLFRSHFSEEQKPLSNDITKIGTFFKRGGSWLSAEELAAEGMDKAAAIIKNIILQFAK